MKIIQDTREQLPMFKEATVQTMTEGDYTTTKLLGKFHIERKSLSDLYGTIIQGHARFKREILRAKEKNIKLVVYVEGTRSDFIMKRFPMGWKRKMKPGALSQIIDTMSEKYDLEFVFCQDRNNMKHEMITRFNQEEDNLEKQ